jgi:hypothetical protein
VSFALGLRLLERGVELSSRRFRTLQQAHPGHDHGGDIPIAAGSDGLGRKALQFRRQGHVVHSESIGNQGSDLKPVRDQAVVQAANGVDAGSVRDPGSCREKPPSVPPAMAGGPDILPGRISEQLLQTNNLSTNGRL